MDKLDNNFHNYNYQEEINPLIKSIDSEEKAPDYNEINEDIFTYSTNKSESPQKDFSNYLNNQNKSQIQINYSNKKYNNNNINDNFNYNNENSFLDSPQKQNDYNLNEDISGISLLKELEEQWNNIEKQKLNYYNKNKGDESTNSNSKNINNSQEKFKYIKDMVECKKNKFLTLRQKAKNIRNNDHEIEQYFLTKFKEMEKYKIIDNNIKEKIEIRQQEKIREQKNNDYNNNYNNDNNDDNYYEENVNDNFNLNNNDINDNNNNYNENENERQYESYEKEQQQIQEELIQEKNINNLKKKSFIQNEEDDEINYNQINNNNNQENNNYYDDNKIPELDDLVYETPARNSNNFNYYENKENIKNNNYNYNYNYNEEIDNQENQENQENEGSLDYLNKIDKSKISGKLIEKMKDIFEEINRKNNKKNINENKNKFINIKKTINSSRKGILGINNINIINNNYTDNNILMNIKNNNSNRNNNNNINNNINDANKSINLNFNYNNYLNNIKNNNQNTSFNNNNNLPIYDNNKDMQNDINKDINNYSKNEVINGLSCLEKNFDDIMKQIKSGYKTNKNIKKLNLFENNNYLTINKENEQIPEIDKYFEELSNEAKLKVKQGKIIENQIIKNNNYQNNSKIFNRIVNNNKKQNNNIFKQKMLEINNNLNNFQIKEGKNEVSKRTDIFKNINITNHQRSLSEFKMFPIL